MSVTDELRTLARILAEWATEAPAATVYLFGSRVRGDHRPGSDVDIHIHYEPPIDDATARWHDRHQETDFADLRLHLPGPLGVLDNELTAKRIREGQVVYSVGNVRCVWRAPIEETGNNSR